MITLHITRVYEMKVEPEWFGSVIDGEVTAEKIADYYKKDSGVLSDALDGFCKIIKETIECPSAG